MERITLYRRNVNSMGYWSIWGDGGTVHIEHATVIGGSPVHHTEEVPCGKQGRSLSEQVQSRIRSRVSRMLDKGYKTTIEDAQRSSSTNQLGLDRPMLANPISKVSSIDWSGAVQQKKLNGHRCLITRSGSEVIAYSRLGKPIPAIKHILKAVGPRIPDGTTVDGELYVHKTPLQTIASWVKAEQPQTAYVNFVGYDLISDECYVDRHAELAGILAGVDTEADGKVYLLPYEPVESLYQALQARDRYIANGFEGGMVRLDGRGYQVGIRSTGLLKVKKFLDAEFKVIDIVPSEKGWGICVCEVEPGKTFKTSAPGSIPEKTEALVNKSKYIGRMLTVEYAELTKDGIPFHCSAISWREDL